jgi:outer membrane immunogenic protein
MKKYLWLACASLALAAPAQAADLEPIDNFSWTGLYIGVDLGYGFGGDGHLSDAYCDGVSADHCVEEDDESPNFGKPGTWVAPTTMADIVGGGHVGYNHQFDGGFVFGAEMDIGFGGTSEGSFTYGGNFPFDPDFEYGPDEDAMGQIDVGLNGSARLRAGFAVDRWLPYVTGGVAYAAYDATYSQPDDDRAPRSGSGSLIGWTLGAGMDYAVTDNIIIGAEYRYTDYGSDTLYLTNPDLDNDKWIYDADLISHDIRIRASLKF